MSPIIIGAIGFAIFFALLIINVPVGISLALTGFIGMAWLLAFGPALTSFSTTAFEISSSVDLACLPLFILMAHTVFQVGIGKDLYAAVSKWLGFLPGGLAMATVGACAGFSAMSASSLATTLTFTLVSVPEMDRYNYKPELSIGSVCAGGNLGILIPPSTVLILYGVLTNTSIGQLFMGGLVPGILVAFLYIITIFIVCKFKPVMGPKGPSYGFKDKFMALGSIIDTVILVVLVLGGLMIGWFTATESGAIGAVGAFLIAIARRRLTFEKFKTALIDTMKTTGMLYLVMIGGFIFMPFVTLSNLPSTISEFVVGLSFSPYVVMGLIIVLYIILGCFMESMSMMLITLPIFFPMLDTLGFSAVWFGIIIVRVMEIGVLTPPLGMNVMTVSTVTGVPLGTCYRGVVPFIMADVVSMVLLLAFPVIVLFLPSIM
jgi:C4-dicarboxylate transporter, DctM subunit